MPPRVSIVMVNHNRARFIEAALRSVLTQTWSDLEVVVWDDGSSDGSVEVVKRVAATDRRVRLHRGEHQGVVAAQREANALARGGLVGWVDSDDLLVRTALEETVAHLEAHPTSGLVYTQHVVIDAENRSAGLGARCAIPYSPRRLLVDFMTHHFRLFRREVWERTGGVDGSLATSPDYDFCLRASEVTEITHLARPLYCYRVHPGQISAERRLEQIASAAAAVRAALARRGMAAELELTVEVRSRFSLTPRQPPTDGAERPSAGAEHGRAGEGLVGEAWSGA